MINFLRRDRTLFQARTYLAALSVVGLVGACTSKPRGRETPVPEAGYVVIKTEAVALPVELPGRTAAFEVSEVRPQVSGLVRQRLFTEGSLVRAGQTLYQIDPSIYQATAAEARANLATAQAQRDAADVRVGRLKPLAQIEAVSKQDLTDAQAQVRLAQAAIDQNNARVRSANVSLRFTRVPAPIGGRIGRSLVTTGGLVTANQADPLTTIQRLDPIYVDLQQSSADLLRLRRALAVGGAMPSTTQVRLTLEDGSDYGQTGTVQFAEAMVDTNTGTVTLRARFPNGQGVLLPGMYVRAKLAQASVPNAILVPQQGVARDPQGRATVLLAGPGDKAIRRDVTVDRTIGDKWLITAGLVPGDRVIVEGLGKIKPGGKIVPVPAGSKSQRKARSGSTTGR